MRNKTVPKTRSFGWLALAIFGLVALIVSGMVIKDYQKSQVVGKSEYRLNLAMIVPDSGVTFVSFDPTEESILALPFPTNLAIKSRGSGEYSISSLYKLGSYDNAGGSFARQKIQGFMRVPIPVYLVTESQSDNPEKTLRRGLLKMMWGRGETNLSRLDIALLLLRTSGYRWREISEDELYRTGVIESGTYRPERLQEYVGTKLFDWGIGAENVSVAVINASGVNGLGSDMADFLTNLGLDVVMVRSLSNDESLEKSEWRVESEVEAEKLSYVFSDLLGLPSAKILPVEGEYRSRVMIMVGKDSAELF